VSSNTIAPTPSERESIWISALRAAAGVAAQAASSEEDVLRAVTEELRQLRLRGTVSLLLPDGQLEVRNRSVSRSVEAALQRLAGIEIRGYRFDPQQVDIYRQALSTGESVYSPNREEAVRQMMPAALRLLLPQVMRLLGPHPLIVSPLILEGQPLGLINVTAPWLTANDTLIMSALADHVAIALGHVRSREKMAAALRRERLRNEVVEAITSALDLPKVLERLLRLGAEMVGADAGAIAMLGSDGRKLTFPFNFGLPSSVSQEVDDSQESLTWQVIRDRLPALVEDYADDPRAKPGWVRAGIHSLIAVPIMVGDQPIGCLGLFSKRRESVFQMEHVEMIQAVARLASIGIQNARLYSQATSRAEESQALIQTARSISTSLELQTVLHRIAEQAKGLLKSDGSRIHLFDPERGVLRCVVALMPDADAVMPIELAPGQGITGTVFKTGEAVTVNNPAEYPQAVQVPGTPVNEPEVLAMVPLMIRERPIGVMTVLRFSVDVPYTQTDTDLLSAFGAHAAIAIENARLYEQATRRAEESQALIKTAQSISSSLELHTVLNRIAEQAKALLKSDGSRIHLYEPASNLLRCVVALMPDAAELMALKLAPGEGLTGAVFEKGETITVNDPAAFPVAVQVPGTPVNEPEVLALAPLKIRQRTIGVMTVLRFSLNQKYTPADVELLEAFAAHAAIAIENADLYGQIASQAHHLEAEVAKRTHELSQSEARYRALVETSLAGIFQADLDGRIVYANQPFASQVGLPLQELIGIILADLFPPDQRAASLERYHARLIGDRPPREVYEIELTGADGRVLPALVAMSLITDEDGNPQGVTGLVLDVSERKKLEAALKAERDRLDAILTNTGDAVAVYDIDGRLEYVNPAWERMTGFASSEAMGQVIDILESGRHPPAVYAELQETIRAGKTWRGELLMHRRDGSPYDAAVTVTPVFAADGRVLNYVGVQYDISAIKEVDRLKSQFVSDVSHELRTPLTNIRLYLDLLNEARDPSKAGAYLETLSRESDRLAHLIDDLLSLSRLEAKATPFVPAPVDVTQLLSALAEDRRTLAGQRGLVINVDTQDSLPLAVGDPRLLTQVFTNLLTNAMNYTPAGGCITLRASAKSQTGNPWVVAEVADTGPGVPPDEQPLIFRRFFRGRASHESHASGTGLGLAICKEIADLHGGRITVESDGLPGRGASFKVWLPAVPDSTPV
jgi:PAS domain S-box-containing protein